MPDAVVCSTPQVLHNQNIPQLYSTVFEDNLIGQARHRLPHSVTHLTGPLTSHPTVASA
ncbi:MAG: hypothetical protein JOY55_15425 [Mycobacterium sp.]|nr:hypothetical protein [Mycobacterium sp.]